MTAAPVPHAEQPTMEEELLNDIRRRLVVYGKSGGAIYLGGGDVAFVLRLLDQARAERDGTLQQHERAISERDDLQRTFDLQWAADQRAIKRWQEAHPGNDLVWPDRANMVVWLMDQLDAAIAVLDDEEAGHQETLRLWQEAKQQHERAMAALREATDYIARDADHYHQGTGPGWSLLKRLNDVLDITGDSNVK